MIKTNFHLITLFLMNMNSFKNDERGCDKTNLSQPRLFREKEHLFPKNSFYNFCICILDHAVSINNCICLRLKMLMKIRMMETHKNAGHAKLWPTTHKVSRLFSVYSQHICPKRKLICNGTNNQLILTALNEFF